MEKCVRNSEFRDDLDKKGLIFVTLEPVGDTRQLRA